MTKLRRYIESKSVLPRHESLVVVTTPLQDMELWPSGIVHGRYDREMRQTICQFTYSVYLQGKFMM